MPDQLTPLARISAAIEKLERLKAESTPGAWSHINGHLEATEGIPESAYFAAHEVKSELCTGGDELGGWVRADADADLIVTLHRTIDAQLAFLREMKHLRETGEVGPDDLYVTDELASAILGGES